LWNFDARRARPRGDIVGRGSSAALWTAGQRHVFATASGRRFTTPDCCINPLFPRAANPPRLFHLGIITQQRVLSVAERYAVRIRSHRPAADDSETKKPGGPTIRPSRLWMRGARGETI